MKNIILKLITLIHTLLVIFITVTPFLNSNYFLLLHAILIPFIILHWICGDNTCVLTILERKIQKEVYGKVNNDECITCHIIEPVYDFRKNHKNFTVLIYAVSIMLFLISSSKLWYKYSSGEISGIKDLFII